MANGQTPPCTCSPTSSLLQGLITDFYQNLPEGVVAQGLSVGVIDGLDSSGAPNITRCHSGYADVKKQKPIHEHTVFEIGSVSKTFTATMLAAAVEDLNATAQSYYDQYEPSVTLPVYTDPQTGETYPMTMLDLADFTSGIPDKDPTNKAAPNEYSVTLMHEYLTSLGSLPKQPGTKYKYVNTNFGIIAELVMLISGVTSYKDALGKLIRATGLWMPHTSVIESNTPVIPHLAKGYHPDGKVAKDYALTTWPAFQGAGAIHSRLDDMLVWLQFNMGLTDSDYNDLLGTLHQVWFPAGGQYGHGLGWDISDQDGTTVVSKNGGTNGFHSWIGFTPGSQTGAVVLCNSALKTTESGGKSPVDALGLAILAAL